MIGLWILHLDMMLITQRGEAFDLKGVSFISIEEIFLGGGIIEGDIVALAFGVDIGIKDRIWLAILKGRHP